MLRVTLAAAAAALIAIPAFAQGGPPPGCDDLPNARDFDFWVGEWDVSGPSGQVGGRNSITKRAGGCVLLERWSAGLRNAASGTSINFVDPDTGKWRQVWVGQNTHIDYSGGLTPDGAMLLEGEITYFGANGNRTAPFRGRWTPNDDGTVTQTFHEQNPETGEWGLWFEGTYTRRAEPVGPQCTPLDEPVVATLGDPFNASGGVSVARDGTVIVSDFGENLRNARGGTIHTVDPNTGAQRSLSTEFMGASGSSIGSDGYLYQNDVAAGSSWRVGLTGGRTMLADGLQSPIGIVLHADGNVYTTECGANAITRIAPDGTKIRIAEGGPLSCPNGLTVGPGGDLYTVNFRGGDMVKVTTEGEAAKFADIPGGGSGHLAFDGHRFVVASFRGGQLFSVAPDGTVTHLAGSGDRGNADGAPDVASFFQPNGVAFSPNADVVYVNDSVPREDMADGDLHPNRLRAVRLSTCTG